MRPNHKQLLVLMIVTTTGFHVSSFASGAGSTLSDSVTRVLNEPAFHKQFAESYAAETEIEPRITTAERDQLQKILSLIASNKLEEAATSIEKQRGPASSAVFDFTLGNIHFQRDQLAQASAAYRTAVEKFPKFRRAWKNLAVIHVRENEFAIAQAALTRVIELGGADSVTYGLLGYAYSSLENHVAAESAFRMANLLDPATLDWKMGLARSFFRQQRYADAIALCNSLLHDTPDRAELWLLQANAYIGMNQPMRAAENYEIVDRLGQSSTDSLNMLGDIYVNEELVDLATPCYIRALEMDQKTKPDRALRAAKVLMARGAMQQTSDLLQEIQRLRGDQLQPEDKKDLLKLQARYAVATGAGDDEAQILEEIVALDPLDGEALILLGQHSQRSGETEKAVFYFERAAGIEQYEADAKVRHAQLLVGKSKYEEAVPLLRRALLIKPRDNVQAYLEQVERLAKAR